MDFKPVVIGSKRKSTSITAKTSSQINKARRTGTVSDVQKRDTRANRAHAGPDGQKLSKLDREDIVAPSTEMQPEVVEVLRRRREELGLTQCQLARKVCEPLGLISKCECPGAAKPGVQVIVKLERELGIHLRGKNLGKEKPTKKKKAESKATEETT